MKATLNKTTGTTKIKVNIKLADECKNGHDDFSITGDTWERNGRRWVEASGGCIHDEILSFFPNLEIFVNLHLCDWRGAPMYAIANGMYHIEQGEKETVQNHFRCTDEELNILMGAEDKTHLRYLVHHIGLPERWKDEADQAIKKLEELTDEEYTPNPDNINHFKPMTAEEIAEAEDKIKSGYWSSEAIQVRKAKKAEEKKQAKIQAIKSDTEKKINEIKAEAAVQLHILELGYSIDNFIYYKHKNMGVFNWKDYAEQMTKEEFNQFLEDVDRSKLPKDIDFHLDTGK